jgi:hypothetical protein
LKWMLEYHVLAAGQVARMTIHEGGCLCGKVRFRVSAPALDTGYCHCRMCQRNTGAPVVAWATFPAASFSWISGQPGTYASSTEAKRSFCATCGSYLVFEGAAFPGEISVNTATLDAPESFPPRKHIFAGTRIPWLHVADDLPTYTDYGPSDPVGAKQ